MSTLFLKNFMQISWQGLSSFEVVAKTQQQDARLVTDPYANSTGLRFPRTLEADIVTISHEKPEANNVESVQGKPFVVNMPGEFEVKGLFVYGISAPRKDGMPHVIYRIEGEGMSIAHLGALDRPLTDKELEELQAIDILMIPVGGAGVLDPKEAETVIGQIEPRVIIPMTHAVAGLKKNLGTVDQFCKSLGVCKREDMNKYKITRSTLPEEDTVVIVLSR